MRALVGHPVDVVTGAVFTAWNDFSFAGRTPITWRRFYTTGHDELGPLGRGWTTEYFLRLERRGAELILTGDEGQSHAFADPQGDAPATRPQHGLDLYRTDSGYRVFDRSHGRVLHFTPAGVRSDAFLLRQVEALSGHSLYLHYDAADRLVEIEQRSLQRRIVLSYTAEGVVERIDLIVAGWRPMVLARYAYDARLNLIAAEDALRGTIAYAYDDQNRLIRETNKVGASFHFQYDRSGRCVRTWGDGGYLERRLRYDPARRVTEVTDSLGTLTRYAYTAGGWVNRIVNPMGEVLQIHRVGGLEQRVNQDGLVTEKERNDRGELVRQTNALGKSFLFAYNERSQLTSITDPGGALWTREYDERGLLVALNGPSGQQWRLERAAGGEIVAQVDPEGRRMRRRYDASMRWQEWADDVGYCRIEYDVFGRPIISATAEGLIATWAYDDCGRLIRTTLADGTTEDFQYDPAGNLTRYADETGAVWSFSYDGFGHLRGARDPLGGEVRFEYDTEGRRTLVHNQNGDVYRDEFDPAGRVRLRTYFDGRAEQYTWTASGAVAGIRRGDGTTIERTLDALGNVIRERAVPPNAPVDEDGHAIGAVSEFEYDWHGWITRATNDTCTVRFEYDENGRLVREQQDRFALAYRYDRSGRVVSRSLSPGCAGEIRFAYNTAGLIESVSDADGVVESYAYDRWGALRERAMRGGLRERFAYDVRHRVAAQTLEGPIGPIVSRSYRYDGRNSLVEVRDSERGVAGYEYDGAGRLTGVSRNSSRTETFRHDRAGNIVAHDAEVRRYEAGSRLVTRGKTAYRYDAAGNQTSEDDGAGTTRRRFDAYGRLLSVAVGDAPVASYGYDALNRRAWKETADGARSRYVWANRTLAGVANGDEITAEVLVSARGWLPAVLWQAKQAEHYVCDHAGRPHEVVREGDGIVWRATYAPFGRASVTCRAPSAAYDLRMPGQVEDQESGLFYNWNRYYDPAQARYVTPDPAGIDAGLNLYDYPRDPVNWSDPMGLSCPNPQLVEENTQWGWQIHRHDDGTLTITADCRRGFTTPKPRGLRPTIHSGEDNRENFPEAHLGQDGRLIVMEGTHRSVAASRGQQMPQDPDNPHLGGVPGRPGYMTYAYSPEYNDDQGGVPLSSLDYPPGYPHKL